MDFDVETRVTPTEDGRFSADIDPAWGVVRGGPNGGYVAAILLRAMQRAVDDEARAPRSITVHFVAPAEPGRIEVAVLVERIGRSMTSCSARMLQGDRLVALALGAFSAARSGPEMSDAVMPHVAPPSELQRAQPHPGAPPIASRWDSVQAIGPSAFDEAPPADEAVVAAWLRLPERRIPDAATVAAASDAWWPAVFTRVREPIIVPTIDLTVHFRSALPYPGATPDDYLLGRFRSVAISDGFVEEDGELWAPDGRLLAQSRQLAAVLPTEWPNATG